MLKLERLTPFERRDQALLEGLAKDCSKSDYLRILADRVLSMERRIVFLEGAVTALRSNREPTTPEDSE